MKIENFLILNHYLLSLFGVNDFKALQEKLRNQSPGFDSDGRSYFTNVLIGLEGSKIPEDDLLRYDRNIQHYVRKINYKREPITLKYFQYLAVLFTEIFLDNLKNRKLDFFNILNEFFKNHAIGKEIDLPPFSENDLKKLAFWMATGSGKTLIMHINYHQFFNYGLFSPDNIILITPNEGLSKQHYEELEKSGIPARLYSGSLNSLSRSSNEVLVIEMTKFVEEKKGGGVSLPVDVFEGRNLVFVDEGHKGKRSEEQKWAKLRDALVENDGFVFEYSATFGQILSEKNREILEEYAKSILFDYSYKYFYLDGYGKDFSVLNVKSNEGVGASDFQEFMFLANLLSFYEQLAIYEENIHLAKEFNLEKPLWIFVGSTVTGRQLNSDVVQIVEFIRRVIDEEDWAKSKIQKILGGSSGLIGEDGEDVFKDKFSALRDRGFDLDGLYHRIFGGRGRLGIYELKRAEGELGLKVGENEYFGVINIGDVSQLKKQLEAKGITISQDALSDSLFDNIKREDSRINILIGSKKFIEGWDTWRVSSLGLLNVGKGQGPQIIQLFGRGVRLKGKGMSLKRSAANTQVSLLETLNIYGIKADYISKFLDAIRKEEVEFETIKIPVQIQHESKWNELYILSKNENRKFEEEVPLQLERDSRIFVSLDLLPKIARYQASERAERERAIEAQEIRAEVEGASFREDVVNLLDWQKILNEIYNFKAERHYWNLIVKKPFLEQVLLSERIKIKVLPEIWEVKEPENVKKLEEIALLALKKYIDLFYRKHARQFETNNLRYEKLGATRAAQLSLFTDQEENRLIYQVQIDKQKTDLIKKIKELVNNLERLFKEETDELPRVYFDKHLFLPILLQSKKIDRISPAGLVESEKKFIERLREYLREYSSEGTRNFEIFLLRNFPKSGVGFQLQWAGFYPDFIMWVNGRGKQAAVFLDPHGLEHNKGLNDEKLLFKEDIKDIERSLALENLILESFILSPTPYEAVIRGQRMPEGNIDLKEKKKELAMEKHLLFLEDSDWPETLLNLIFERLSN